MRVPASYRNPWTGQTWTIRLAPNIKEDGKPVAGLCNYEKRELLIDSSLHGHQLLEILIHEAWHSKGARNRGHRVSRNLSSVMADVTDILVALGLVRL